MDNLSFIIALVIILLILNGIFSAGEIAIVSCRKSRIKEMAKEKRDKKAEQLLEMKENPERFLSAVQIGITLFGTLASAIGGVISISYLKPIFDKVPLLNAWSETISLVIIVVIMTYLFLVIGELLPKYVGINYKERVALWVTPLFQLTFRLFSIFIDLLTFSTMCFVKAFNLKRVEDQLSESELKILLEEGRKKGVFDKTEEELINGIFDFSERSVKDIMVPRPNIYAINIEDNRDKIIEYVIENEFSRYPVYKDNIDNIIGIVYQKDIFKHIWLDQGDFNLHSLIKRPYFVPDTMKISTVLKEMQKNQQHLAIVVDEYGITIGIVTLEDIMEEIFGEIMDETDVDDRVERLKNGSLLIDASYSVRDLNNRFGLDLPESPEYETLGGFILTRLQGIPRGGEVVIYGQHRFTVAGLDGRRISKVRVDKLMKSL